MNDRRKPAVVAGGTGFIGRHLISALLDRGYDVRLLVRKPVDPASVFGVVATGRVTTAIWSAGRSVEHESLAALIEGAYAVINLSGESIGGGRWTAPRKENIRRSRVEATGALAEAIGRTTVRPAVFISGSAVGYYGTHASGEITESEPPGSDFLASVCVDWESEAQRVTESRVRLVCLRTGIVLGADGGALQKMLPPFRLFAGGPLGSGRQWMPWIHINDAVAAICFALEHEQLAGPVNIVSPHPVMMDEFAKALGIALHRPSFFRVPQSLLRMILGEMSLLVLEGQRAVPRKLLDAGFRFSISTIDKALNDIISA